MKKIIVFICMAILATNINAQLVVDSLGRVGIGTETPQSLLSIGNNGNENAVVGFGLMGKQYGIRIFGTAQYYAGATYGVFSNLLSNDGGCYGGKFNTLGGNDLDASQYVIGVCGEAGRAKTAVGVQGRKSIYTSSYLNFAGLYGSELATTPSFTVGSYDYSGSYAGYFRGRVRVTNGIYATVLSPTESVSSSGDSGMTILSDRGESVTDKLSQVQTLQFLRYDPSKETSKASVNLDDIDFDSLTPEEADALAEKMDEEPEQYLSPVQYGLAADQLKEVYPELVYEDANGNVSINYVEMVPLLVQSINELKSEIAELKGTSAKKAKAQATAIDENVTDVDMVRMDQNKPNPFSGSTVIALNIPRETQSASIFIYDMIGKQVQSLPVSECGETNITVYASGLTAGMYIYTLVVDGKVAVTRRMIVTL